MLTATMELDIEAILEAQGSDAEEDAAAEGLDFLDAQALDRRLEEILNAEEEDDEDEFKSSWASPHTKISTSQGSLPAANFSKDNAYLSEFTTEVPASNEDGRSLVEEREGANSRPSQIDARIADSEESPYAFEASIAAAEELSPGFPASRTGHFRTFSPDMSVLRDSYRSDVGQHSPSASLSAFNGMKSVAMRPGAALSAAATASSHAHVPWVGSTSSYGMSYQDELMKESASSQEMGSAGGSNLSSHMAPNAHYVINGSEDKADVSIGGEDTSETHSVHIKTGSLFSSDEHVDGSYTSNGTEIEDDVLLLEEKLEVFTNDDNDDDDEETIDIESSSFNDLDALSSTGDDSDQEEIKSCLLKDPITSDSKALSPGEKNTLHNDLRAASSITHVTEAKYSALDKAEEMEKKAAFSGIHIEEGAASQPKRLMDIQTGPPSIGYVHLETVYSVSQILSLSSTIRDRGTGQAISMHDNQLAIGLSKGSVLLLGMKTVGAKSGDLVDTKPIFLSSIDKAHAAVTSLSFNMQGDLLMVGHANGFLALWELSSRGGSSRPINVEHSAAILHTAFFYTKYQKAITADCKGLVILHSISLGAFGRYSVTTQCLVDGQNTGMVLCLSPLLLDVGIESSGNSSVMQPSVSSTALTSMMGGMVRGVVAGKSSDLGKRAIHEGGIADEAGNMVVFVTHQSLIVFRLPPSPLEKLAKLSRPEGIRDGGIPYIAWRRLRMNPGGYSRGDIGSTRHQEPNVDINHQPDEGGEKESHPLLVLGWDKKVFILQLLKGDMKILVSWDLDSVICGVSWLDEQVVAIVTLKEQVCLFTSEGLEMQRVTIELDDVKRSLDLSYHTHMLNTFGNPEKTYFSSVAVRAGTMYLLGSQRIYRARLLPWQDQLKALQDAGDWMGAFHVGMELFDGRSLSVMGLPRELESLQKAVVPTLLDLLSAYIDEVFTYLSLAFGTTINTADDLMDKEELMAQAKEQYARVGGVAIEFCVHIRQTDVLFDNIFHKFCTAGQRGTFLELLEPYILNDTLGTLAPEVMQGLVEYYSQMGWVQRVELCVLHMDIGSLDFNQVVRLCRENGLYSALIYLFNRGLDDYSSPLEELLIVMQDVSKSNAQTCGYKLLIYLKYCFLGLAFPPGRGEIPNSRLLELRRELLQCLLDSKTLKPPHSADKLVDFQSIIHPRLSCLLSFDLLATLEVLRYAFPENGPLGIGHRTFDERLPSTGELDLVSDARDGRNLLQDIIGALTDILERIHLYSLDGGSKSRVEVDAWRRYMSKIDAGYVMEFIAEYVALGEAKVTRVVLARILDYLACSDKKAKKLEDARRKEAILVKLLNGVPEADWDSVRMLELALQAQFWQASACLLAKKGDFVAALDSFMKDTEQPYNGFLFILDVLNPQKQSSKEKITEFRSSVLARLPQLLQLSSEATLIIMLKHFSKEHRAILSDLAPYPPLLFQYLKQIMSARLGYKSFTSGRKVVELLEGTANIVEADRENNKTSDFLLGNESLSDLLKNAGLEFSNEMEELYVELLCQFEPKSVLKFLKSFEDYRLEHCLKLCQEHGVSDAAAYLLERVGDIGSALSLVLANTELHMHEMDLSVARLFAQQVSMVSEIVDSTEQFLSMSEIASTCADMQAAIELCQRNTWRINPGESEALWFHLLDRFVEPLRTLHESRKLLRKKRPSKTGSAAFYEKNLKEFPQEYKWKVVMVSRRAVDFMQKVLIYLIGEIVNGMMGYVPLSVIMDKLLSSNGKHEFGDFKGTILQMLGLYGYEQTILFTAKHVVEDDMFSNLSIYKRRASRGYAPQSLTCCICKRRLHGTDAAGGGRVGSKKVSTTLARQSPSATATNSLVIFSCGHAGHSHCIFPDVGTKRDFVSCPSCPPKIRLSNLSIGTKTRHKVP